MQSSNKYAPLHPLSRIIADAGSRYYNAHETGAMEPFALALACGDAEFKVSSSSGCLNCP